MHKGKIIAWTLLGMYLYIFIGIRLYKEIVREADGMDDRFSRVFVLMIWPLIDIITFFER